MSNYLRNRPFMLISYAKVPAAGQNSQIKNFGKLGEWDAIENMKIVDRVSTRQLFETDIVIDILEQKVLKNRMGGSEQTVYEAYIDRYNEDVKGALSGWIGTNPANLEILQKFLANVKELEDKAAGEANEQNNPD